MKFIFALIFSLNFFAYADVEERLIDFQISPAIIYDNETQANYSWMAPLEYRKTKISITDAEKVSSLYPQKNHLIASKLVFQSKKSFAELAHAKLNSSEFISKMFSDAKVNSISRNRWKVGTKVMAYKIPFNVNFELDFQETTLTSLPIQARNFIKDEMSVFEGTGKERILILNMTKFSQLLYQTYAIVYIKEMPNKKTVVFASVISGFDKNSADNFFDYPPFATTKRTVLSNVKSLIKQMIATIK